MGKIEKSVTIKAPPERVWPLVFWDRLPEWLNMFKKIECTSENRESVGATFHVIGKTAGLKTEFEVELLELVEHEKAAWRSSIGGFGESRMNRTDEGVEITFVVNYALPYSVIGKILDKLMVGREIEKSIERGFKRLQSLVEKQPGQN